MVRWWMHADDIERAALVDALHVSTTADEFGAALKVSAMRMT